MGIQDQGFKTALASGVMTPRQPNEALLAGNRLGPQILPRPSNLPAGDSRCSASVFERLGATKVTRRERARRPKVRTGCVTCKARRVKCDERKPTCARCESADVACQGYVEGIDRRRKTAAAQPVATTRSLAPHPAASTGQDLAVVRCVPTGPSTQSLAGHQDGVYFDYFRHQVTANLAGFYTCPVWSQLVSEDLQDHCIQHSILAVGALVRSLGSQSDVTSVTSNNGHAVVQHRNTALRYYLKAVKSLRERIGDMARTAPRTVVISTLLLVVFELVQGQAKTAETLLDSSLQILKDFISLMQTDSGKGDRGWRDVGFADMEFVLPCISVMNHLSNISRPQRQFPSFFKAGLESLSEVPRCGSISLFFSSWGRFFTSGSIFVGHCARILSQNPQPGDADLARQQEMYLSQLQEWKATMAHYAKSPLVDDASKKALRIAQIHWLLLRILLACCLDPTQLAYDAFQDEFRELTVLCTCLYRDSLSHPRPTSVLLGQGLILPLCTVVRACRDHDTRMMAVEALDGLPPSMVPWDIVSTMDGILGAVLLEEIGRDKAGFVPPRARWFWLQDEGDQSQTVSGHRVYQSVMLGEDNQEVYARLPTMDNVRGEICKVRGCTRSHGLEAVSVL